MISKKILSTIICMICAYTYAQNIPVKWNYSAKKISEKVYELHLTATVSDPWHIYSQTSSEDGALPTKISFIKNPLLLLDGKTKENGKMESKYEKVFGVDVKYFNGTVDFVQIVNLKKNVSSNISGTIEFMLCNNKECLTPQTTSFSVKLE